MAQQAAQKTAAEVEFDRLGFAYQEVAQFDLTLLDPDRRVQVRDSEHYAPKEQVARYANQMAQSPFPPIVVTIDNWIVDGNTRVGACLKRGLKHYPAYVLDVVAETASDDRKNDLDLLAATLNEQNGMPLSSKEIRKVIQRALARSWTVDNIARALGVSGAAVGQVKREIAAEAKLTRVGLSTNGASPRGNATFGGASLRALGAVPAIDLNDDPFKGLAELSRDAGLNATEIRDFAKELKELPSDTSQLDRLTELRTEAAERIRLKSLTGIGNPPLSRMLRQHLGFIVKNGGNVAGLVEHNPDNRAGQVEQLDQAIKVLQQVLTAQKALPV